MSITMEIALRPDESLSHTFNVPALFIAAGSPAKPLIVEYQPTSDGPKTMLVSGRTSTFGVVGTQIVANQGFHVGTPPLQMDEGWGGGLPVPGIDLR